MQQLNETATEAALRLPCIMTIMTARQYDASWYAGGDRNDPKGVELEMKEQTPQSTRRKAPMSMHSTSKPCNIDKSQNGKTTEAEL